MLMGFVFCVQVHNGGMRGAPSTYFEVCSKRHLPGNVDIVVAEFNINDEAMPSPAMQNPARRSFERLLRKLLSLPSKPAVILLNVFKWFKGPWGQVSIG